MAHAQAATTTDANTVPVSLMRTNDGIEAKVRAHFPYAPVMTDIARCESKFRQYTDTGNALHGGLGAGMIGVFQINAPVHADYAKSLGMDIYSLEGNLAYAKLLYEQEGTQPWISSFSCWGTSSPDVTADVAGAALVSTLTLGVVSPEVLTLQKMLNSSGFAVAEEGPGSPGQETSKFGTLTRTAVRKFQCAKMDICSGDEYSTGYGMVGAKTRVALLAIAGMPTTVTVKDASSSGQRQLSESDLEEVARLQSLILELTAQLNALLLERAVKQLPSV